MARGHPQPEPGDWTNLGGLTYDAPVRTVNVHEAKTHLSRLIEEAAQGEPFVIARAGVPVVTVMAYAGPQPAPPRRVGFLTGAFEVPDDFDTLFADGIAAEFEGA